MIESAHRVHENTPFLPGFRLSKSITVKRAPLAKTKAEQLTLGPTITKSKTPTRSTKKRKASADND